MQVEDFTIEDWQKIIPSIMRQTLGSNGRYVLYNKGSNKFVFSILRELGCFSFYTGNTGAVIGVSQVIAFLHIGYKALANGFTAPGDEIEVHHIDGDICNNDASNLIYLSKQDHHLVSCSTNTPSRFKYDVAESSTPFNKRGKSVTNPAHYLANIIKQTLEAVCLKRGGLRIRIEVPRILLSLPKSLHKRLIKSYLPSWLNASIINSYQHEDVRYVYC